MPRYTIFNVTRDKNTPFYQQGDTAHTVLSRIAAQIHRGSFSSRADVDFEDEADAIEAQSQWAINRLSTRLIVEYEWVDNHNIRVLGFRDVWSYHQIANYEDYFYRYNQPLLLNMAQTARSQPSMTSSVPTGIAEIRWRANRSEAQIIPNQNDLNPAQSTHTASVHTNVEKNLKQQEQFSNEITAEHSSETTEIKCKATKRMPSLFNNKEEKTSMASSNNMVKEHIIQAITEQKNSYEQRINNQWFGSMRQGAKKNLLIQFALDTVIKHIEKDDFSEAQSVISKLKKKLESEFEQNNSEAQSVISKLKKKLESEFGQNNVFEKKSESFKLVESIEMQLINAVKKRLQGNKEEEEEQQTTPTIGM